MAAEIWDFEYGTHKNCGGTVEEVHDQDNWPDERILGCLKCEDVVQSSEVEA